MDPTGLLEAVLAVAVYPGAAFLAVAALLHGVLAGRRAGVGAPGSLPTTIILPVLSAALATAMLPMPGSPALRLPPASGVTGNVVVIVVLLAVAVDLGGGARRMAALAGGAALPVLALAAVGNTVSVVTIAGAPGSWALAARALAAALLVLAASTGATGRSAAVVSAGLSLTGAALVIPALLAGAPPILGAAASLGVVALGGILCRWRQHWTVTALAVAGVGGVLAGTALALLSARS